MRRLFSLLLILFLAVPAWAAVPDRPTRQAAEKLMDTLGLERRVDSILQLYLQLMPQGSTPEEQMRAKLLRERAPGAGGRFRGAVTNAAVEHYSRAELAALDQFFGSEDGQKLIATAVGRALMGVTRGSGVKSGDLLRPEDFAGRPGLEKVAVKYPGFETAARNELAREFAMEIGLLVMK